MPEAEMRKFINEVPAFEIRKATNGASVLCGYAAKYNSLSQDLGGFREIIRPGAFDECLATNPDVSARIQHDGGMTTIGRTTNGTLRLISDEIGLWYEIDPPDTQAGRDIMELVSKGYINKSSFAFSIRNGGEMWHWENDPPLRELLSLDLYDVAPVDGPAYESTSAEVRSTAQRDLIASRERFKAALPKEIADMPLSDARKAIDAMKKEYRSQMVQPGA